MSTILRPARLARSSAMREIPTIDEPVPVLDLSPEEFRQLTEEIRALAAELGAVILAHNDQVPEIQALRKAAPRARLTALNPNAVCRYMKMITLPKLRDSLCDGRYEIRAPADIAQRARVPIERMVAIG